VFDVENREGRTSRVRAAGVASAVLVCASLIVTSLGSGVAQALMRRLLPTGPQTVVLKVQFRGGGSSSFSGTFAGKPLKGNFEKTDPSISAKLCPTDSPNDIGTTFTYGGKYNGTSYVFNGCVVSSPAVARISFRMTGRIGSVSMSGRTVGGALTATAWIMPFRGKVGSQAVSGTATLTGGGDTPNGVSGLTARLKIGP
jgi:hypothetical protein